MNEQGTATELSANRLHRSRETAKGLVIRAGLATDYSSTSQDPRQHPFPDVGLNDVQLADQVSKFLSEKKLD